MMKRICIALCTVVLLLLAVCAAGAEGSPEVYTSGDYRYTLLEDGTAQIMKYTGNAQELIIPDTLDGMKVTAIGDLAFYSCSSLTAVTIPESVTAIGDDAFSYCSSLIAVTIPDSVTAIGDGAFSDCSSLTATVTPDSYAEQYCIDHNLPYTFPDALDWLNN